MKASTSSSRATRPTRRRASRQRRSCRARRLPRSSAKATSTSTNTGASWCASTGTRRRTSPAAAASRRYGPASNGAASTLRASGWKSLVHFLEGDPDQPLVVGCVYNDKHMPPYDLPADKSISGVKSNSTPGGNGFNEFIFDDKDGEQLVRLHAQKEPRIRHRERRSRATSRRTARPKSDKTTP